MGIGRGRFVPAKDIAEVNINKYKERNDYNQYQNMIQGTPTLVTYYNINDKTSSLNDGTLDIEQYIGVNSPLRFNKILEAVIWFEGRFDLNLEVATAGLKSDIEGTAIVASGTFKPMPLDLFCINYLGKNYFFKVTSVNVDTIRSRPQYKIDYKMSKLGSFDKIESQVDATYRMIFDNIGTKDNCILLNERYNVLESLKSIRENLIEDFETLFFDERVNAFIYKDHKYRHIYSPDVTKFIIDTKLLIDDDHRDSLIIDNIIKEPYGNFLIDHRASIWYAVTNQSVEKLDPEKIYMMYNVIDKFGHTVLSKWKQDYWCAYNIKTVTEWNCRCERVPWFRLETFRKYKLGIDSDSSMTDAERIIGKFLCKKAFDSEDLAYLNTIVNEPFLPSFIYIPLFIHIINWNIRVIQSNVNLTLKT